MAGESATSVTGSERGRLLAAGPDDEIWLRGNLRPVAGIALGLVLVVAIVVTTAAMLGGAAWAMTGAGVAVALLAPVVTALAFVASRPRLRRRGDRLEVRLSPVAVELVPLEVVECVFPGSRPLPATAAAEAAHEPADRRVTTVILRLAERAAAWRQRPTFAPWGTWADGHIIIDGRWCEPLSAERTRALATRLMTARRGRGGDCSGGDAP